MFTPTLIVKPVGLSCNLACTYCYNNPERFFSGITRMSDEVLAQMMSECATLQVPMVRFIWHGGEPTLAGIEFYEQAVEQQAKIQAAGIKVQNSIQTNGTLLNQQWMDFFLKHNFRPGLSIDGPEHIHNAQRVDLAGRGTFSRVYKGLQLLQQSGIRYGVNAVITRTSLSYPLEIYDFFKSAGVSGCDFSPCAEVDPETGQLLPFSITPDEYAQFMRVIFDQWFQDDNPEFRIRRFSEFIQGAIGGKPHLCEFNQACHNYLAIDYDGSVFLCGRFMGTDTMRLGNLVETSLQDILASDRYQQIKAEVTSVKPECQACKWLSVCKGGCTYYRHLLTGELTAPNYLCPVYKTMFEYVSEKVTPLLV